MRYDSCINDNAKLSSYHTPISFESDSFANYLSGFTDGEGSFCVSINKSLKHKFNYEIRPSFSISQNKDRAQVLYYAKQFLNCGSIRESKSDNTLKYEVRSIKDLYNKVIPHFDKYPILSSKHQKFLIFKEICLLMINKDHLNLLGFKKIINLIDSMGQSNHRKYNPQKIKI